MSKHDLTAELLKTFVEYDPETGIFFRLINSRRRKNMRLRTGSANKFGYIVVHVNGFNYLAHRLAWLYVHGAWPENVIDHINCIPADNRIDNLRSTTLSVNAQNRRLPFSGKSTPLGVSFLKRDLPKRFTSAINVKGKKTFLGYFFTAEDAEVAYLNAKRKLHEGCTV